MTKDVSCFPTYLYIYWTVVNQAKNEIEYHVTNVNILYFHMLKKHVFIIPLSKFQKIPDLDAIDLYLLLSKVETRLMKKEH